MSHNDILRTLSLMEVSCLMQTKCDTFHTPVVRIFSVTTRNLSQSRPEAVLVWVFVYLFIYLCFFFVCLSGWVFWFGFGFGGFFWGGVGVFFVFLFCFFLFVSIGIRLDSGGNLKSPFYSF